MEAVTAPAHYRRKPRRWNAGAENWITKGLRPVTTEHIVTEKPERCPAWNHGTISGQCAHPAGHDDSHQLYLGAGLAISWWGENEPEPSTEEPERTLTAVEDDTDRHRCPEALYWPETDTVAQCEQQGGHEGQHRSGERAWSLPEPRTDIDQLFEPVPYDASVEDRHEHGFTFREGLGYLADDPFCDGCCELATAKWKSSWKRPTTDAEKVTADVDAKTAEAGDL